MSWSILLNFQEVRMISFCLKFLICDVIFCAPLDASITLVFLQRPKGSINQIFLAILNCAKVYAIMTWLCAIRFSIGLSISKLSVLPTIYFYVLQPSEGGNLTSSTLRFQPKVEDMGKILRCRAENPVMPASQIEDTWTLDVNCKFACITSTILEGRQPNNLQLWVLIYATLYFFTFLWQHLLLIQWPKSRQSFWRIKCSIFWTAVFFIKNGDSLSSLE